jgi:2-C-methyl-D-erythritol 4-phosphate cytidylyltransferase
MNSAIIVAAGSGARFGGGRAKQFRELAGIPLIVHTLRRFERAETIDEIIAVAPPSDLDEFRALVERFGLKKPVRVAAGGATRTESVWRGLQNVNHEQAEIVAVHDGVRPLVSVDEIDAVMRRARETGAAILASPAIDTIKEVEAGRITRTLERANLWHALTPQCFRFDVLHRAYTEAITNKTEATDDSALVERLGARIFVVEGDARRNIKITTPADLALAEKLIADCGMEFSPESQVSSPKSANS